MVVAVCVGRIRVLSDQTRTYDCTPVAPATSQSSMATTAFLPRILWFDSHIAAKNGLWCLNGPPRKTTPDYLVDQGAALSMHHLQRSECSVDHRSGNLSSLFVRSFVVSQ
jgi:hypothetical protein